MEITYNVFLKSTFSPQTNDFVLVNTSDCHSDDSVCAVFVVSVLALFISY